MNQTTKTKEEYIKELLKPIAEEGVQVYEYGGRLFNISLVENALIKAMSFERTSTLQEVLSMIPEEYKPATQYESGFASGFNDCRSKIIASITSLMNKEE